MAGIVNYNCISVTAFPVFISQIGTLRIM